MGISYLRVRIVVSCLRGRNQNCRSTQIDAPEPVAEVAPEPEPIPESVVEVAPEPEPIPEPATMLLDNAIDVHFHVCRDVRILTFGL